MKLMTIAIAFLVILGTAFASENLSIRGSVAEVVNGTIVEWDSSNFDGFYYDMSSNLGYESLQLLISGQSVETGDAVYSSQAMEVPFGHEDWGNYRVVSFLGRSYFAGYDDCKISSAWNSLENGILIEVLIDSDERKTVGSDEDLILEEGYRIRFSDAEDGVKVTLYSDKNVMDSAVITPPATYVYSSQLGDQNATLLAVHVAGSVKLKQTSYYTVKGIFQISKAPLQIEPGFQDGLMELASSSDEGLVMTNYQKFDFVPNDDFQLMDGFGIKTADQEVISAEEPLRFYIYRNVSEPGEYKIRGNVGIVEDGVVIEWDPSNFDGFYYDINDDIGNEKIAMTITDSALSEPNGVMYVTSAQEDDFEFEEWGNYWTIGFLSEVYFAGYADGVLQDISTDSNLLVDEQLSRVLIDSAESRKIESAGVLKLEKGFEAKLFVDNSCENVFLELYRNGNLIEMDYFDVPGTYAYTADLGESQNVVILALHVADVNCTDVQTCTVDGIWQISDTLTSVEEDSEYDKMTIQTVDADEKTIMMDNEDNKITLSRNKDISLMGDIRIKTADQDEITAEEPLRFYVYKPVTIEA